MGVERSLAIEAVAASNVVKRNHPVTHLQFADAVANGNEDDPSIAITLTATDVDGPIASFRLIGLPANGVLYIDPALTLLVAVGTNYPASGNALTLYFAPAANWNGATSFQFTATDAGGMSDATPATAVINVAPVNDPPIAIDGSGGSHLQHREGVVQDQADLRLGASPRLEDRPAEAEPQPLQPALPGDAVQRGSVLCLARRPVVAVPLQ